MGEHTAQQNSVRSRTGRKGPSKQTPQTLGRQLLAVLVYAKRCRGGGSVTVEPPIPSLQHYQVGLSIMLKVSAKAQAAANDAAR